MEWRPCVPADREALTRFECTTRPTKSAQTNWHVTHPRFWEYEVQTGIRNLRPPFRSAGERAYVLEDHDGLAAVCHLRELDGPSLVELEEIAVALHHRGNGVAKLAMDHLLDEVTDRALANDVDEVIVQGCIWHENTASLALARSVRMDHVGNGSPGVLIWQMKLLVSGADFDG